MSLLRRRVFGNGAITTPGVGYLQFSIDGAASSDTASIYMTMHNYTSTIDLNRYLEYSTNASEWYIFEVTPEDGTPEPLVITGTNKLYIRGINSKMSVNSSNYVYFVIDSTKMVNCTGNIMRLLDYTSSANDSTIPESFCFFWLFHNCTKLKTAPTLPATTLKSSCYKYMFANTGLITAPALPATTLASSCYAEMFSGCTSLTTPPSSLPATTLPSSCYTGMFEDCAITAMPTMPTTIVSIGGSACWSMFEDCTSLTSSGLKVDFIKNLTAAKLSNSCFKSMFLRCTGLTTLPSNLFSNINITTTQKVEEAFAYMFKGCTNLTNAVIPPATGINYPTSTAGSGMFLEMYYGCSKITTVNGSLSATTIDKRCYMRMFMDCSSLTTAPSIAATTIPGQSLCQTFSGCSNLQNPPTFTASSITAVGGTSANNSTSGSNLNMYRMFYQCTKLTKCVPLYNKIHVSLLPFRACEEMYYGCTSLTDASTAVPDTSTAGQRAAYAMFEGCTNLVTGPTYLKAESIDASTYARAFYQCSSMTNIPTMIVTSISGASNFATMFRGCTSLTSATSTSRIQVSGCTSSCFSNMFYDCSNLVTPPAIYVNTTSADCCGHMFRNCSKLQADTTTKLFLSAPTLTTRCYEYLFYSCRLVNKIKAMFTTTPSTTYTRNWVSFVSSSGTYIKNAAATYTNTGVSAIPSGWTVQTASS